MVKQMTPFEVAKMLTRIDPKKLGINDTEMLVLLTLVSYMDKKGYCFPNIDDLMLNRGKNKNTIIRSVNKLVDVGLVIKGKLGRSSNYTFNFDKFNELTQLNVTESEQLLSPPSEELIKSYYQEFVTTTKTTAQKAEMILQCDNIAITNNDRRLLKDIVDRNK